MVENGANVDAFSNEMSSALSLACFNLKLSSSVETVRYLINKVGISLDSQNQYGMTPLMYLAQNDATFLIELLIEKNVKINQMDNNGNNALMIACLQEEMSCQTIEVLIAAGSLFDPSKYEERNAAVKSYLKERFPLRFLEALDTKLMLDLKALNNRRPTPAIINKMNLEWGNDLPLNDVFQLPYHRVLDGVQQFIEAAKAEPFYEVNEWQLDKAQRAICNTVEALARAAHTSEEGRRMAEEMAVRDTEGMRKRPRNENK